MPSWPACATRHSVSVRAGAAARLTLLRSRKTIEPVNIRLFTRGEQNMAYKFEVYKDKAGEFRFRFKAPNGENMFASEGYAQKASAISAIESIKKNTPAAAVDDQTK
jgi:uncharacterized protein YegP (UPF0339 family)